jgi:hypothetical protein
MAELHAYPHLYAECLAAMAVSGEVYPCDTLAPAPQAECSFPVGPTERATQDHHAATLPRGTERT